MPINKIEIKIFIRKFKIKKTVGIASLIFWNKGIQQKKNNRILDLK